MNFIHFIYFPFSQVIGRIRKTPRQDSPLKAQPRPRLQQNPECRSALKAQPRSRLQQNPECQILQLPCELILSISDELAPQSQVLLSETCRCMWALLGKDSLKRIPQFSWLGHVKFMSMLARDYLDWWFCYRCMSLHRVKLSDNYHSIHTKPKHIMYDYVTFTRVKHRHVQLALKYTRLQEYCQPYHQECLRRLLAPYYFSKTVYGPIDYLRQSVIQWSCYPKVALGQDGRLRYLLLAVLRLPRLGGRTCAAEPIGCFNICPHLAVNFHDGDFRKLVEQRILEPYRRRLPLPHVAIAIQAALEKSKRDGLCGDINKSEEVCDGCTRCPLDFSVRVERRFIELRVWQDFGPEGAETDLAWQIHVDGTFWPEDGGHKQRNNIWNGSLVLPHVPGSIRRLYEGNMEDAELK